MEEHLKDAIIGILVEIIERQKFELSSKGRYIETLQAENAKLKEAKADVLPQ